MQSIRSRIIIGLIRHRHLFRFKLKQEIIDETFSVEEFRLRTDKAAEVMNKRLTETDITNEKIDGLNAEWICIEGVPSDKVILYIHGGGFISGSCHTHRAHVLKFVKKTKIKALLFDYRLAPENPFPAALDDTLSVYDHLLNTGYSSSNIIIAGESAGGTLVLSALKAIRDSSLPNPAGAVSISPVTDLRCTAETFTTNMFKDIAPPGSMRLWTDMYIGNSSAVDPLLSPQFGKLSDLPKTLLIAGTHEIHLDDTKNYYNKAIEAGSEAELKLYENMVHAFPIMAPLFPEAEMAMHDIAAFIRKQLIMDYSAE